MKVQISTSKSYQLGCFTWCIFYNLRYVISSWLAQCSMSQILLSLTLTAWWLTHEYSCWTQCNYLQNRWVRLFTAPPCPIDQELGLKSMLIGYKIKRSKRHWLVNWFLNLDLRKKWQRLSIMNYAAETAVDSPYMMNHNLSRLGPGIWV